MTPLSHKQRGFCVSMVLLCDGMNDEDGAPIESAPHPKQRVRLPLPAGAQPGDFLRRRVK